MELTFDAKAAENYQSPTQKIRVLTEKWAADHLSCPRCGNPQIEHFPNNRAVADFFCPNCKNEYELKSKKGKIGSKIADGAYDTFIERITSEQNPDFFIMSYDAKELCVNNLWIIPKFFFVPDLVEKRKPLSQNARRAGWVGCNILFDQIPLQGRINIVHERNILSPKAVQMQMEKASALYTRIQSRGWMIDVLNYVNRLPEEFSLEQMYAFENVLQQKYPDNHNIRPKIRQQLQMLRDRGVIEFCGKGNYRRMVVDL